MNEPILLVVALFVIAGGGIIVIDAVIIRRIRRGAPAKAPVTAEGNDDVGNIGP